MTKVKICGIQRVEVLQSMVHLPIDWIGFVFAKSRRQVTAEQAAKLISDYRSCAKASHTQAALTVGVYVNPTFDEVEQGVRISGLDVVQLHGQESAAFCRTIKDKLNVQVFKAFPAPIHDQDSPAFIFADYIGIVDGVLLDTVLPNAEGGTGLTFDWTVLPYYISYANEHELPLLVAGGLNQDNVGHLIEDYQPFGVDVSSGVETDGQKDLEKIKKFVERVKQA
jgi:phosphoribosylanthranilate isomerase